MAVTGPSTITTVDSLTGWSYTVGPTSSGQNILLNTANQVEGSGCAFIYAPTTGAVGQREATFDIGSGTDFTGLTMFWWLSIFSNYFGVSNKDNANPGIQIHMEDTSGNWSRWNITGQDTYTNTNPPGQVTWKPYATCPADSTPDTTSGTLDVSAIRYIRVRCYKDATGANQHIYPAFDYFTYGRGLAITGGTVSVPLDIVDITDADEAAIWGLTFRDGNTVFFRSWLDFGAPSGSTDTYFVGTDRVIIFDGKRAAGDVETVIVGNGTSGQGNMGFNIFNNGTGETHFTIGVIDESTSPPITRSSYVIAGNDYYTARIHCHDADVDEINFYGLSSISGLDAIDLGSSSVTLDNVDWIGTRIGACGPILFNLEKTSGTSRIINNIVAEPTETDCILLYEIPDDAWDIYTIISATRGITIKGSASQSFELSSTTFLDCTTDVYFDHSSGTMTVYLDNSTTNPTTGQTTTSLSWDLYERNTYDVHVQDDVGADIGTVLVRLENAQGTEEFEVFTDVNGDITQQKVVRRTQEHSSGLPKASPTETTHTPFVSDIRKYGYIPLQLPKAFFDVGISDVIVLQDDDVVQASAGTVAAYTGITINEATTPDRIEVTVNHTLLEVMEWCRWKTASTGNGDLPDPIISTDGVTFTVNDYDFLVNNVTLTADDQVLYMPTKDYTESGSGNITGIIEDVDGRIVKMVLTNVISGSTFTADGSFTTDTPSGAYNGVGDTIIQFTGTIPSSFATSGDVRLFNGTYYETYAYTGVSGAQLTGVTPVLSQDFDAKNALLEMVAPTTITADPYIVSVEPSQNFEAMIANQASTRYIPVQISDNTGSNGFSLRVQQIEE